MANTLHKGIGIGINAGRIRGINSKIRGGEVQHTGVVPFLKKFESTVRCCTQNGIRGGSATVHFPIWHQEIQDILVLKNNKGTEDNRVRKLDYSIQISKLFYERFIKNEEVSLFSPHDVPGLFMMISGLIASTIGIVITKQMLPSPYNYQCPRTDSRSSKREGRNWSYLHYEYRPL